MGGGGAERVALTLIGEFLGRGHEVDLVLVEAKGELLPLVPPEARVFDLKARRMRQAIWPLVRYLHERRPDAVQARLWPLTAIAIASALVSRTGARVVTSDHAVLSRQYGHSRRSLAAVKATTRWLYPLAAARICVSEGVAADLSRLSGLRPDRFTIIHNPVRPPAMPIRVPRKIDQLWKGGGAHILAVGSLKAVKNYALLIRSFALLDGARDARLMILGEGPERPRLERLAHELGVADRVLLPGFAADPWPYYASADLLVSSSDHEGFGNVLVEAMLAGVPVVSTDCPGGPRHILSDGRFGTLVPVGDPGLLAKAIAAALGQQHDLAAAKSQAERISGRSVEAYSRLLLEIATD